MFGTSEALIKGLAKQIDSIDVLLIKQWVICLWWIGLRQESRPCLLFSK